MTTTNHLLNAWQSFQREVIPPNAPPVQHDVCRDAFYAGAAALFELVTRVPWSQPGAGGADAVSEDAGAAFLEQINQELQAYARAMARLARELRR